MNLEPRVTELLDRYLDGALAAADVAELEAWLSGSEEVRAAFWERAHLHAALRMVAQERRGAKLAREAQTPVRVVAKPKPPVRVAARRKVVRFPAPAKSTVFSKLLAIAAVLALSAGALWLWQQHQPVARIGTMASTVWEGGHDWATGKELRRGSLTLTHGVAEITFLNGARLVIEGPTQMDILGPKSVRLHQGRLSAAVPPPAHGFSVETPNSKVVDLGTRFGVAVESNSASQVHVFEGKVTLGSDHQLNDLVAGDAATATAGQVVTGTADARRFPQSGRVMSDLLKNGDFESGTFVGTEMPGRCGEWGGDPATIVDAAGGISPRTGSGMLSFQMGSDDREMEQWQLVDLSAVKEAARGSTVQAAFSVWLNRLTTGSSPGIFTVTLAAFHGAPERALELWGKRQKQAVALDEQTLWADGDPKTWQRLDAALQVPPEADFLLVCIAAKSQEPAGQPPVVSHFADSASLEVRIPPVPSLSSRARITKR